MEGPGSIQLRRHYLVMTLHIAQTTEEPMKVGSANAELYFRWGKVGAQVGSEYVF